jgi:hypothetical protein
MGSPLVVDIYFLLVALLLLLGQPISFVRTCHISQCHAPAPSPSPILQSLTTDLLRVNCIKPLTPSRGLYRGCLGADR